MPSLIDRDMEKYSEYLSDESRLKGKAQSISFPVSADEVCADIAEKRAAGIPVTIQGSRTGITGAAVPAGGHIVNMSAFNRIEGLSRDEKGNFFLKVQPGVLLSDIDSHLSLRSFDTSDWSSESREALLSLRKAEKGMYFPPNPTEKSASAGGMFSCNSRGINSLSNGCAADYIEEIELCLPDGKRWTLKRGSYIFDEEGCSLPDGRRMNICADKPSAIYKGLNPFKGMDLIDLFAGSEGMLGAVLSLKLRLCPRPETVWGFMFFLSDWQTADSFAASAAGIDTGSTELSALEFFDEESLSVLGEIRKISGSLRTVPEFPQGCGAAVYAELSGEDESAVEEVMLQLLDAYEQSGGLESNTWASCHEKDLEMFRLMRHAVPEAVNTLAAGRAADGFSFPRVSMDCRYSPESVSGILHRYREEIEDESLRAMVFGHYGDGRLHVEFLPENDEQYSRASRTAERLALRAFEEGAVPAGENGIGKLKKYIINMADRESTEIARLVKKFFDPNFLFNPDNF